MLYTWCRADAVSHVVIKVEPAPEHHVVQGKMRQNADEAISLRCLRSPCRAASPSRLMATSLQDGWVCGEGKFQRASFSKTPHCLCSNEKSLRR